jgi:hypothetical protein
VEKKYSKSAHFCPIFAKKALIFANFLPLFAHFLLIFAHFFLACLAQTAQPNSPILVFTSKTNIPPKKNLKKSRFPLNPDNFNQQTFSTTAAQVPSASP